MNAEILIVDEVLAVGDFSFQNKCVNKMEEISESGRTVIFVSHNIVVVNQLCTKVILLDKGSILMEGLTNEVTEAYISSESRDLRPCMIYEDKETKVKAQIKSVSVANGTKMIECIDLKDEFEIKIEYVFYASMVNIFVGMQIIQISSGQTILSLPDPKLDQWRLGTRNQGHYRRRVKIPGNLLNIFKYIVRVGISDHQRHHRCR